MCPWKIANTKVHYRFSHTPPKQTNVGPMCQTSLVVIAIGYVWAVVEISVGQHSIVGCWCFVWAVCKRLFKVTPLTSDTEPTNFWDVATFAPLIPSYRICYSPDEKPWGKMWMSLVVSFGIRKEWESFYRLILDEVALWIPDCVVVVTSQPCGGVWVGYWPTLLWLLCSSVVFRHSCALCCLSGQRGEWADREPGGSPVLLPHVQIPHGPGGAALPLHAWLPVSKLFFFLLLLLLCSGTWTKGILKRSYLVLTLTSQCGVKVTLCWIFSTPKMKAKTTIFCWYCCYAMLLYPMPTNWNQIMQKYFLNQSLDEYSGCCSW